MAPQPPREPTDKNAQRAQRNFLSAAAMLGHLCGLYDRGVFEAGRLMSNLLFQLAVKRKGTNTPLIEQVGIWDSFRIAVDVGTLSSRMANGVTMSPLVSLIFGLKQNTSSAPQPAAIWLPAARKPTLPEGFAALSIDQWLDDAVIPTTEKILSRRELIVAVRDQDGGAHSDPGPKFRKSLAYVELVNSFPISKLGGVQTIGQAALAWELLPPVTMPILRQIAHEMISALFSLTVVRDAVYLPTLVCIFRGSELQGAYVPQEYPDLGPVYGSKPAVVARDYG